MASSRSRGQGCPAILKTTVLLLTLLLALLAWSSVTDAVDRSKFKTCQQSSFCRRNRQTSTEFTPSSYHLADVQPTGTTFSGQLLHGVWVRRQPLQLTLSVLQPANTIHLKIDDAKNPHHQRFELPSEWIGGGEGSSGVQRVAGSSDAVQINWIQRSDQAMYIGEWTALNHRYKVEIELKPLVIRLYADNQLQQTMNDKNLLTFEQYRAKNPKPAAAVAAPAPAADDGSEQPPPAEPAAVAEMDPTVDPYPYDSDGMWSESFGGHTDSKPRGPSTLAVDITFAAQHIYGLPEHASDYALRTTVDSKGSESAEVADGDKPSYNEPYRLYNLDVFEYEMDVPMALYGAIPFIMSHSVDSGSSGFLWLNAAETYIDVSSTGAQQHRNAHYISESGAFSAYIFLGPSYTDVLQSYHALTGFAALPPLWSIGYHQCRWNYRSQDEVAAIDAGFDDHDISMDTMWLDIEHTDGKKYFTWDASNFPDPKGMQDNLKSKGRHLVTIVDPHIKRDSNYYVHTIATESKYYVRDSVAKSDSGKDYEGWCWPGSVSYLDFTVDTVRQWWSTLFQYSRYEHSTPTLHVWNDMNEPSVFNGPETTMQKDNLHMNGQVEHRDVHNIYGQLNMMSTFDGLLQRNKAGGETVERPFVLSRAFFAGSQRYGAIWTGDNRAEWSHLKAAQPMLLSLNTAGLSFSGADVGGFFKDPDAQLLTRWNQAAVFHPFFRGHAHIDTKHREPWVFGEPHTSINRHSLRTRYALLPYLYTLFYTSHSRGLPVMRSLWMEFPADKQTLAMEDSFMLGPSLLVQPIVTPDTYTADVYLPSNSSTTPTLWYAYDTFHQYNGGQVIQFDAPLERIPVFIRGGTVVVRKDRPRRSSTQMLEDPYTLVIALDASQQAAGEFYVDDGRTYKNEQGEYVHKQLTYNNGVIRSTNYNSAQTSTIKDQPFNAQIERIIVVGTLPTVRDITITADGSESKLTFIQSKGSLVIRRPDVRVGTDLQIQLHTTSIAYQ